MNLEMPVIAFLRPSLDEDDHRADRVRPLNVRDVVALDAVRRSRQIERRRKLGERARRRRLGRFLMREKVAQVLLGVLLHEAQVIGARAALRAQDAHALSFELREPHLDHGTVLG